MEDCKQTKLDDEGTIIYTHNGNIVVRCVKNDTTEMWYNKNNVLHRDDGPTKIFYENGQKTSEHWYRDGKQHRDSGPAKIFYENGQKTGEYWYRDDKYHRDDGPAVIYYRNGQKTKEYWYRNGELCPINTLASVIYKDISSTRMYWIDGKLTKNIDEFRNIVRGDAIHDALRALPIPIRQAIAWHYCYQ